MFTVLVQLSEIDIAFNGTVETFFKNIFFMTMREFLGDYVNPRIKLI